MNRALLRAVALVCAAVVALVLHAPAPASAASPYVGRQGIGLNGISFRDTPAVQQSSAARIAATGAKWVRIEVDWWFIQDRGRTSFDWASTDSAVAAANARGLQVLLLVQKTPPWARTTADGSTPPTNVADYAQFAATVVGRYRPQGVKTYQVWNEPNLSKFWADPVTGKPNTAAFVTLLRAAYTSMKAVRSDITVVSAGLSPYGTTGQSPDGRAIAPVTFLQQMYAAGARGAFDALGWHPYTAPALPNDVADWNAWSQMSIDFKNPNGTIRQKSARTLMIENGDRSKKIWMTEAGASTVDTPSLTEAGQATAYRQAITARASYDWAGPILFYTDLDYAAATAPTPHVENHFGVHRTDGSPKPAVDVLRAVR